MKPRPFGIAPNPEVCGEAGHEKGLAFGAKVSMHAEVRKRKCGVDDPQP
jgi:hypothetical protein